MTHITLMENVQWFYIIKTSSRVKPRRKVTTVLGLVSKFSSSTFYLFV